MVNQRQLHTVADVNACGFLKPAILFALDNVGTSSPIAFRKKIFIFT